MAKGILAILAAGLLAAMPALAGDDEIQFVPQGDPDRRTLSLPYAF
jgi:hypothetical protein